MYNVLIVSLANWDSLTELPVVFKQAGCNVDLFCRKGSWVLENEFYDNWITASNNDAIFIAELLKLVEEKGEHYNWIIPGDDILIRALNDSITFEGLFYKIMPLTKIENRDILGSKAGFSNLCKKYDISTPRFLIYDETQTTKQIGEYIGYPLMLKTDRSEAGTGVFKCRNEEQLKEALSKIADKDKIVFQQFIEGEDINLEVLYKNGELMVYSYARILKILGTFGLSTQRMFSQNTDIRDELVKMGRSIGISGFASIAFVYNRPTNKHYLIEIDLRPNSWIYYGKFTGNDFSEAIKKIIAGDLTLLNWDSSKYPQEVKISLYKKDMARAIVEKDINGILYWWLNKENCRRFKPTYDKTLLRSCNKYLWWFFGALVKGKIGKVFRNDGSATSS